MNKKKVGLMDRLPANVKAIVEEDSTKWANAVNKQVQAERAKKSTTAKKK